MECRWSLSWRHAFRECEDMTPTTTIVSALKRGVLPWTQMPVSTFVATFIVLSCVHKAVYTWAHRPRRRDGKQYGSYGSNLDECPSTPDSSYAILASDIGDDYQLSRPKSLARIQIAKAQEEEHLFSLLAVLMRQVAFGFTCKALVHAVLTTYTAHREGISALPAFFDSTDELTYAYLIRSAAAGFEASAKTASRAYGDVSNMLEALTRLRELWGKMRLPLLVQTCIKTVQLGLALRDMLQSASP